MYAIRSYYVMLQGLLPVVQEGVLEVQLAAGGAADKQAGEAPRLVERLHEEGLGTSYNFV